MITVEEVKTYLKVKDELYKSCKEWAKNNLRDWQHYCGFKVEEDTITIEYTFQDYWSNSDSYREFDSIKVPINEILQ